MKILSISLGSVAAVTLAMAAPAQAQKTEPNSGLPYCSRNVQDGCIQRGDVKRNDFEKRQADRDNRGMPADTETQPSLNSGAQMPPDTGMTPGSAPMSHPEMQDMPATPGTTPPGPPDMPGTTPETTPPTTPGMDTTPEYPGTPGPDMTE